MKDDLEIWLDASASGGTKSEDVFYYDDNWGTLIGYNDSFGSGEDINDHHFHYGYYVRGASGSPATTRHGLKTRTGAVW